MNLKLLMTRLKQIKLNMTQIEEQLLSSKELRKYEYLTSKDLGYKPGVFEKVKYEHSPLGVALNNKVKSKTDKRKKVVNTDKQDKNLIYNSRYSFVKFKDIIDFKQLSLDSMHKN